MTMKNQIKKNKEKQNQEFWNDCKTYFKLNYPKMIVFFVTLIVVGVISFFKISTTSTVASYNIEDYEVGQIADITIKATKTLPPTFENPISVEKDEKIIKKGFPITEEQYAKLKKMAETTSYFDGRAFANTIVYLLLVQILFYFFTSDIFKKKKFELKELITENIFYIIIYGISVLASKTVKFSDPFSISIIIPSSFFILLITILFGQLSGIFFSIIISLGILNAASYQIIPSLFAFSTSLCSVKIVKNVHHRSNMVLVSLLQMLLNIVFALIFKLIFNYPLKGSVGIFLGIAANGFISGILCLGMLTPLEMILNTASPFRLTDLSDTSNPIFEEMKVSANGTYSHSQNVATLAEAACREIGANALLARVGAQYHDIGKLDNPEYFTENQIDGENIHDRINPTLSVSVIRSHVKRGVERAQELHLPKQVIDIIAQHHGNQVIEYFYNEALKTDPNANPADFSYSGAPPETKESAVVMLADTVEAATRTLKNRSIPSLDKFIWALINKKIEHHQLDNSDLTYSDIKKIHDSFLQILTGIYHSRIEYPDQKQTEAKIEQEVKEEHAQELAEEKLLEQKNEQKSESKTQKTGEFKLKAENSDQKSESKTQKTGEFKLKSENLDQKSKSLAKTEQKNPTKSESKKTKTGEFKIKSEDKKESKGKADEK